MKAMKILVADDEPGIRDLISEALSAHGHTVLTAENGVEAVACLAGESVDVVFLDIRMPRGDGLTALKEMRRLWPELPVVMITGGCRRDEVEQGFALGAFSCSLKPFSLNDIPRLSVFIRSEELRVAMYQTHRNTFALIPQPNDVGRNHTAVVPIYRTRQYHLRPTIKNQLVSSDASTEATIVKDHPDKSGSPRRCDVIPSCCNEKRST